MDPRAHATSGMEGPVCNPNVPSMRWEAERGISKFAGQSVWQTAAGKTLPQQEKVRKDLGGHPLTSTHTQNTRMFSCECMLSLFTKKVLKLGIRLHSRDAFGSKPGTQYAEGCNGGAQQPFNWT